MKLADAARTNDEAMEGGTSLTEITRELGYEAEEVTDVAEQRALRAVVYQFQGQKGLDALLQHGVAALGHTEASAAILYGAMYLDGIAIGLRAASNGSSNDELLAAARERLDWIRGEYGPDDLDYATFAPLVELLEAKP